LHPLPPKTATPFPQRWGQLRKGRTVFRREDRVDRFTVAKNNGRLLTVVKNVERFTLAKNNDRLTVAKNNGRLLTVVKNVERFTLAKNNDRLTVAKNYAVKSVVGRRRRRRCVPEPNYSKWDSRLVRFGEIGG